ncbi:MAG: hypothetical protein ACFFFG_04355 [Candidatus Thorarchaeota archaeon]
MSRKRTLREVIGEDKWFYIFTMLFLIGGLVIGVTELASGELLTGLVILRIMVMSLGVHAYV